MKTNKRTAADRFDRQWVEQVQQLAHRMLRSFPNVRRWDDTDDVTNLACLRVWKALRDVPIESEKHFYRLVAKNIRWVLLDLARSHGGPGGIHTNHDTWHGETAVEKSVPSQSTGLERWTEFHEAVEQLDPEIKDVFDLLWYSGVSHAQAAEILGMSHRALRYRWRRAKVQLAKLMQGQQPPLDELSVKGLQGVRSNRKLD